MKKVITLVLALALLATSVAAFADATPGVNAFPTLSTVGVSNIDGIDVQYYKVILSAPVDRFYILWNQNKDGGAEELAVYKNAKGELEADAMAVSKKWMPGVKDNKGSYRGQVTEDKKYEDLLDLGGYLDANGYVLDSKGNPIKDKKKVESLIDGIIEQWEDAHYSLLHSGKGITDYTKVAVRPVVQDDGRLVTQADSITGNPELLLQIYNRAKKAKAAQTGTNSNKPSDAAYAAVVTVNEVEFVGFYNRAGQIVAIEKNEGRF